MPKQELRLALSFEDQEQIEFAKGYCAEAVALLEHDLAWARTQVEAQRLAKEDVRKRLRAALQDRDKVRAERNAAQEAARRLQADTDRMLMQRNAFMQLAETVKEGGVSPGYLWSLANEALALVREDE